jgi:hypothetical protein
VDTATIKERNVSLRNPDGEAVVTFGLLPAAAAAAAALILVPRLTAVAAIVALFRRMSLSIDD